MIAAPRRPIIIDQQTDQAPQSVFTIHNFPNKVMAWRIKNENLKTAVVAFKRSKDVQMMGHMIEHHYEKQKEWPDFTDPEFSLTGGTELLIPEEFKYLTIREWRNMDSLKVFCVDHYLDLILVNRVAGGYKIQGHTYTLDAPMDYHIDRLEHLYIWSSLL